MHKSAEICILYKIVLETNGDICAQNNEKYI